MSCADLSCHTCNPPPVLCDKCQTVMPRLGGGGNLDGGMEVQFVGWYGGTIDPTSGAYLTLCDSCARAFLQANSWLGEYNRELSASV